MVQRGYHLLWGTKAPTVGRISDTSQCAQPSEGRVQWAVLSREWPGRLRRASIPRGRAVSLTGASLDPGHTAKTR
jgi:hypothetical protein